MKTQVDSRMARSTAQGTLIVGRKGVDTALSAGQEG